MHRHRPFSKATWSIYLALLAFRILIALSPGYLHPDEYFQSAEITAGNIFGIDANIPWEYQPELPCRSILIPAITTGVPYLLLRAWIGNKPDHYVTTRALFITQRLAFVLISIIIDWAVVRMTRQIRRSPSVALLLVSSSYVTLAYHTHPFSNTVETVILALCATLLGTIIQKHDMSASPPPTSTSAAAAVLSNASSTVMPPSTSSTTGPRSTSAHLSFGLGVLFSVGIFTRITFVLYGFPLGVMFLYLNLKTSFKQGASIMTGASRFVLACIPLTLGLGLMSTLAVVIDSVYFRQLVYNLNANNLAQHGLHPRFFHLFLNYPVLFGNLAWVGVTTMWLKVKARQWTSQSKLVTALSYSGICGISFLSSMPHQEARFLTPLILPLVVSLSGRISKLGRKFWPLWLLTNGIAALLLGLFHQSGLVPGMGLVQHQSLGFQDCKEITPGHDLVVCQTYPHQKGMMHVADGMSYTTHLIFYKTYMPPHHLLGYNVKAAAAQGVHLSILDWREKSREELIQNLTSLTKVQSNLGTDEEMVLRTRITSDEIGQRAVLFRKTGPAQFER
ncbi:alpha 1,2 mannosyltransferase [Mortierella claussenii]|nr:alpha 1,2 mannosyltransferase [Mortierella claussenii]